MESSYLQKLDLSPSIKGKYPLALIKLMTRYAEDLIWSNKITKADAVLKFIVTLTVGRSDASALRKGKVFFLLFCATTFKQIYIVANRSQQNIMEK